LLDGSFLVVGQGRDERWQPGTGFRDRRAAERQPSGATRPAAAPKEFSIETLVDTWTRLASHKKA
jgi:hypothetical protein